MPSTIWGMQVQTSTILAAYRLVTAATGSANTPSSRRTAALGVFAHEYTHDLGVPDLYDYLRRGERNRLLDPDVLRIHTWAAAPRISAPQPSHMGAWEKFRLGWLNYEVAYAGQKSVHKLGPMETNTKQAQGLFVVLPKKPVVSNIGAPYAGSYYYYSGAGDNLDYLMYKSFNLAVGSTLTAKVKYNIELNWDYAYVAVSTDDGVTWTGVPTNLSTPIIRISRTSGTASPAFSSDWVDLIADLRLTPAMCWSASATGPIPTPAGSASWLMRLRSPVTRLMAPKRMRVGPTSRLPASMSRTAPKPLCSDNYYVAEFRQYQRLRQNRCGWLVQLRLPGQSGAGRLGGTLPIPGRPADQLLGYIAEKQPGHGSSRPRPAPDDRLASHSDVGAPTATCGVAACRPTTRPYSPIIALVILNIVRGAVASLLL